VQGTCSVTQRTRHTLRVVGAQLLQLPQLLSLQAWLLPYARTWPVLPQESQQSLLQLRQARNRSSKRKVLPAQGSAQQSPHGSQQVLWTQQALLWQHDPQLLQA
jgi:hypothetical protein